MKYILSCRHLRTKFPNHIDSVGTTANTYGPYQMLSGLFVAGVVMILTGFCWDMVFPINKKIWTSSYAIYTSGLATITIGTMIYLIEFRNARGWLTKFFDVFGKKRFVCFCVERTPSKNTCAHSYS